MSGVAVTAVERVLDVLELFQNRKAPLSLTEISELAGIPKSSCHAITTTLLRRGYLYGLTKPRSLYPTRRLYDVASEIHESDPYVARITPLLERLRDTSRETVILGKRQADRVIYLQVVESENPIRYSARPGEFKPLHSSSIGKALLGSLKETDMRACVAELDMARVTTHTQTEHGALIEELVQSRHRGYFLTRGENVSDVWAVSAFLTVNAETLAIAIAGPQHRMEKSLAECAQLLLAATGHIARQWNRV